MFWKLSPQSVFLETCRNLLFRADLLLRFLPIICSFLVAAVLPTPASQREGGPLLALHPPCGTRRAQEFLCTSPNLQNHESVPTPPYVWCGLMIQTWTRRTVCTIQPHSVNIVFLLPWSEGIGQIFCNVSSVLMSPYTILRWQDKEH